MKTGSEWLSLALRVNGMEFEDVCLRTTGAQATDFEVVVKHRPLGSFSLHEGFVLEVDEGEKVARRWRSITRAGLKKRAFDEAQNTACEPGPPCEASGGNGEAFQNRVRRGFGRIPVEGDWSHMDRAREALSRAGIQFRIVGGLSSSGQVKGHVTLTVPTVVRAGHCLPRVGFVVSPESKFVLVDSQTGWKVRLLESRPNPQWRGRAGGTA